jgi:hypothetical protein
MSTRGRRKSNAGDTSGKPGADAYDLLGEAFGRIEDIQKSLTPLDVPLIKYLLDMAKLEIARQGVGLPFGQAGRTDPNAAWLKALRDEEDDEPEDQLLAH